LWAALPGSPGTIKESLRTIWQIGRVRVGDAGPDGNPDSTADNTVLRCRGVCSVGSDRRDNGADG
jgi:hypothetical protein